MMQTVRILVATSTRGFGQLIQQTLEESGRYSVTLVNSVSEALASIDKGHFTLSILDDLVKGGSQESLAQSLRSALPDIKLIVIPPDNDLASPAIASITPDGYLTKPFYLPDLFDTIEEVLGSSQAQAQSLLNPSSDTRLIHARTHEGHDQTGNILQPLDWLEDINLAAQHLTRLSLESAAHAALIVRNDQLWAYAGQLSQQAAEELASIVTDFWHKDEEDTGSSGDKIRFARLMSTTAEYLLYVTALGDGMVLALAFDTETPFSKIRTQAGKLARALSSPPEHVIQMDLDDLNQLGQRAQEGSRHSLLQAFEPRPMSSSTPVPEIRVAGESYAAGPKSGTRKTKPRPSLSEKSHQSAALSEVDPVSRTRTGNLLLGSERTESLKAEALRPLSPAMHYLSLACLLIPRMPAHHLIGELAASLAKWLSELCLAYGWRLEHQSIRPGYLLWIAHVSPSTSPSIHIRILRSQTSQRIFTNFPQFKNENPSGDFWAPGYLIVSSAQPPAAEIIHQYIDRTRHHQGA